jgi:hypothetical protein
MLKERVKVVLEVEVEVEVEFGVSWVRIGTVCRAGLAMRKQLAETSD